MPNAAPSGLASITPSKSAQINQPVTGQIGVVLANLSTFVLLVSIGSDTWFQAPQVEQFYDTSQANGAPLSVSATELAGDVNTIGYLTATWYGPGEDLPDTSGFPAGLPALASSIAQYVGPTAAQIGSATATSTNALGIPGVGKLTALFNGQLSGTNGTPMLSTAAYNSVIVTCPGAPNLTYYVLGYDASGNVAFAEQFQTAAGGVGQYIIDVASLSYVQVFNQSGGPYTYIISGANLAALGRVDSRFNYSGVAFALLGSQALAAGSTYTLTLTGGDTSYPPSLQGSCWARFWMSNGTAAAGYFYAQVGTNTQGIVLADSTEMGAASFNKETRKQVGVPAGTSKIFFNCATAGTTILGVTLTPMAL